MDMVELGGEEEDRWTTESSSKSRSLSASSDTTVSSAASKQQVLRLAEDLSLPSVQVVVMSANMGCSHCRQRVANVVSKMNGEHQIETKQLIRRMKLATHQDFSSCAWFIRLLAGLLDYMVDFGKKEVTVRGKVHPKKKKKHKKGFAGYWEKKSPPSSSSSPCHTTRTLSWFLGCYGP